MLYYEIAIIILASTFASAQDLATLQSLPQCAVGTFYRLFNYAV